MAKKKNKKSTKNSGKFHACQVQLLPTTQVAVAAQTAIGINPANAPRDESLAMVMAAITGTEDIKLDPSYLGVLTTKWWGAGGVKLGVSFMDNAPVDLRERILLHANAWGKFCNVSFSWSQSQGEVRISRGRGGYWSYLGTDILQIPKNQPTMNLEGFTMRTQESEFIRVVRHEVGHTLGFPHEHMRRDLVARLDEQKTIRYFQRTQGWSPQTTRQQVLTPLEDSALHDPTVADQDSLMTYHLPGDITRDGKPIRGGADFSQLDRQYAARIYPLSTPQPPPTERTATTMKIFDAAGQLMAAYKIERVD